MADFSMLDYEALVIRLIGLPGFLGSERRSQRKYGKVILEDIIMPKMNEYLILFNNSILPIPESLGPKETFFNIYLTYIGKSDYENAGKYAREWLSDLRKQHENDFF
jgi:hypothetical protein